MEILASLCGQRSKQAELPKQLSLFSDSLLVSSSEFGQQLQGATKNPLLVQAGLLDSESQIVDVPLPQSNQNPLLDPFHSQGSCCRGVSSEQDNANTLPNKESVRYQTYTRQLQEIPDCVTVEESSPNAQKSGISSALPPPGASEEALADINRRASLDFILGRPRADHRDKPTFEQVKRARLAESHKFLSERVLARLEQLEAHENNNSLRADYRQAFITVSLAAKGNPQAFVDASYAAQQCHPDHVWPRIVAKRKAMLGREYYQFYDSNDLPRPDIRWDDAVVYDLPSSAEGPTYKSGAFAPPLLPDCLTTPSKMVGYSADSSSAAPAPVTSNREAAETGADESLPSKTAQSAPVHPIQEKERLA